MNARFLAGEVIGLVFVLHRCLQVRFDSLKTFHGRFECGIGGLPKRLLYGEGIVFDGRLGYAIRPAGETVARPAADLPRVIEHVISDAHVDVQDSPGSKIVLFHGTEASDDCRRAGVRHRIAKVVRPDAVVGGEFFHGEVQLLGHEAE